MNNPQNGYSRRDFLKTSAALSTAAILTPASGLFAAGAQTIKLALIGCGGRGNGALRDCIEAAAELGLTPKLVAAADYFLEKAQQTAKQNAMDLERCFGGANGYKKALASDADVVILATPPIFRPRHLQAAIDAGKHVFMEKPVAVDPPGARKIIEAGQAAKDKKLAIVTGTQRRHNQDYLRTQYAIEQGAIGELLSGEVWWCMGALWYRTRNEGESDADYLVRNWVSFAEMSGDHIVEQHVHNIDIANWYMGNPPSVAVGFGGRARRKTGNQFDFFCVNYDYGQGRKVQSMCRQVNGCYGRVGEQFVGTHGTTAGSGPIRGSNAKKVDTSRITTHENQMVQEHIDLLAGIIGKGTLLNEAQRIAESTMTAIMGRISAYTGQILRWSDLMDPDSVSPWYNLTMSPAPEDFENGTVKAPAEEQIPVPGDDGKDRIRS